MLILNIVPFLLLLTITQANVNLYVLADNFLNGSAVVVGNYDNVLDNSTLSIGTDPTYLYYDSRYITYYPGGSPSIWWVLVFNDDRKLELALRGQDRENMPGAINVTIGDNGCVAFNGSNSLFYYGNSFYSYPNGGAPYSAIPVNLYAKHML